MKKISFAVVVVACMMSHGALTQSRDISQLGTTLTWTGAEIAGNAQGTIPAYTGGMKTPPAGYSEQAGKWIDPFADEHPILSISAANLAEHEDKVTPGTRELIRRWPNTYRMDIYPTHRAYPEMSASRIAGTRRNLETCKLAGNGLGLDGCWHGVPFPFPSNGMEAMWNHLVRPMPVFTTSRGSSWVVDAAGNKTSSTNESLYYSQYWDPGLKPDDPSSHYYILSLGTTLAPPRDAGSMTLLYYSLNPQTDQRTWGYTRGQRRTRLAPEFAYDTPITSLGGVLFYDEVAQFAGRMDRFDFKLLGKREYYVPYNTIRAVWSPIEQTLGSKHLNPGVLRWELHRVWVVEATLKPGMRHAIKKRYFYLDEDSWYILASEGYDQADNIVRVIFSHNAPNYVSGQGIINFLSSLHAYNLSTGVYSYSSHYGGNHDFYRPVTAPDKTLVSRMTPQAMAGAGVR